MAYRNITVDGKTYQYVVGKTYTKIKTVGVFKNEEIGRQMVIHEYCDCCGESMSELYPNREPRTGLAVRPHDLIRRIRLANKPPVANRIHTGTLTATKPSGNDRIDRLYAEGYLTRDAA